MGVRWLCLSEGCVAYHALEGQIYRVSLCCTGAPQQCCGASALHTVKPVCLCLTGTSCLCYDEDPEAAAVQVLSCCKLVHLRSSATYGPNQVLLSTGAGKLKGSGLRG